MIDDELQGSIQRITYHHSETGFCVLQVVVAGSDDPVCVVGYTQQVVVGAQLVSQGRWINSHQYGRQWQAKTLQLSAPSHERGMVAYLGSGIIKGIGEAMAQRMVDRFGDKVFAIIEQQPQQLARVPGIGKARSEHIHQAFIKQKKLHDLLLFLHQHHIDGRYAQKIYKRYGAQAQQIIKDNPYQLAWDIVGIGFSQTDYMAKQLGYPADGMARIQAGIYHAMQRYGEQGHTQMIAESVLRDVQHSLGVSLAQVEIAVEQLCTEKKVYRFEYNQVIWLALQTLWQKEYGLAGELLRLMQTILTSKEAALQVAWFKQQKVALSVSQQQALQLVFQHPVAIITGGPGVGKTTIVKAIVAHWQEQGLRVALCAPTGRAAKRLQESTGEMAQTIHRLLRYDAYTQRFVYDRWQCLDVDAVIVDEASMIDVGLAYALVQALADGARLLWVGDADQLPSVGPGAVLADMIRSGVIPVVCLQEVFRQAQHSQIIMNAHRINEGKMLQSSENSENNEVSDFYCMQHEDPLHIQQWVVQLVTQRIPQKFSLDPMHDIMVLAAMQRGPLGVRVLNQLLQRHLRPQGNDGVQVGEATLCVGDRVMQQVNNYDKRVFNGDIGWVTAVNSQQKSIKVLFSAREVDYAQQELVEIVLAYAITVHKSQGSEYPAVVIPWAKAYHKLLARNVLYTAITRARQLAVVVAQPQAMRQAVETEQTYKRYTGLAYFLQQLSQEKIANNNQ